MLADMNRKLITAAACGFALLVIPCSVFGQAAKQEGPKEGDVAPLYAPGDQAISIQLGMFLPLFNMTFDLAPKATNLTIGGGGALQWGAYLTESITLSGEVGGVFAFSPNMNILLELPMLAKAEKIFTFYPFEIPVSLAAGVSFVKYEDLWAVDIVVKPGAGFFWIYDSTWSFGVNAEYWVNTQISGTAGDSRVGNFLKVFLSALYRF
jgi:hypothetical protein